MWPLGKISCRHIAAYRRVSLPVGYHLGQPFFKEASLTAQPKQNTFSSSSLLPSKMLLCCPVCFCTWTCGTLTSDVDPVERDERRRGRRALCARLADKQTSHLPAAVRPGAVLCMLTRGCLHRRGETACSLSGNARPPVRRQADSVSRAQHKSARLQRFRFLWKQSVSVNTGWLCLVQLSSVGFKSLVFSVGEFCF